MKAHIATCIIAALPFFIPLESASGTDIRVNFTLNTHDPYGAPLQQDRYYWVYRPDSPPAGTLAPMVLLMQCTPNEGPPAILHRKADEAGFVAVSCSFSGNSSGTPGTGWTNDNPLICGYEDYDYITEVIGRVRATENGGDAFVVGLSKGGHTALAYACERPEMVRAAASLDEFMGLTTNIPSAPVPIIVFQGTSDSNVPCTMVKDTVDAWRAVNGLMNIVPVTTYESAPLSPGSVSQATWRGGLNGTQVAFVTIVGGGHSYPLPGIQTGYDFTDGVWAFFSQFLTTHPNLPEIVSRPVNNIQRAGQPASFRVVAAGINPLLYQWQRNGEDIPGATGSVFTIPAVSAADNGAGFRVIVSDGTNSVTSSVVTLTVISPPGGPVINNEPASLTVAAGRSAGFTVSATGTPPLIYQWRKNGLDIQGATGASYLLPVATPFDSGATFRAAIADAGGTAFSVPATLTVTRPSGTPIIIENPTRALVLAGQPGSFSVAAWSNLPLRYQWQKGVFTGHMMDIPGATAANYETPPTALTDHHALFRCVVSNSAGSVASASEMLFVTTLPAAPRDITSAIRAVAQAGMPFTYTIVSPHGTRPLVYSAAPLPPELSVDPVSGVITGVPIQIGNSSIVIGASNSAGHAVSTLELSVINTPPPVTVKSWRSSHFGASACDPTIAGEQADPDGDGYDNGQEFLRGSDPLRGDPAPGLALLTCPRFAYLGP